MLESLSTKSTSRSSNRSWKSNASTSTRIRALETKAKQAELKVKIAALDQLEELDKRELAAKRDIEKVRLMAESAATAAVSRVYENAMKEDDEHDLGSDDPDIESDERVEEKLENLNPEAKKLKKLPPSEVPNRDSSHFNSPMVHSHCYTNNKPQPFPDISTIREPQPTFWERMELRMSQPLPKPVPFDGNPTHYLTFKTNFEEQVESKVTLTDSEKLCYLMSYTTGKAREAIENYRGLPDGYRLALQVLKQRFGQNAMIVQALKSSVVNGTKIKPNDNATLLSYSDKIKHCYWSMVKLQSNELDCTTNMRLIYDRLPDPLQRKWRRAAKTYRQKFDGKEPGLKELSEFIFEESQSENDPVYAKTDDSYKKTSPTPTVASGTRMTTLATQVSAERDIVSQVSENNTPAKGQNQRTKVCKVCEKGNHDISKCFIFRAKNLNWRRRFATFNTLCYRCLSSHHLRKNCPSKLECSEKDCPSPVSHHQLIHISKKE